MIAERVCTDRQLYALKLHAGGLGYDRIAEHMHITPESVRGLIARAEGAIRREQRKEKTAA